MDKHKISFYESLLFDPIQGEHLKFDEKNNVWSTLDGIIYPVKNGIPVIVIPKSSIPDEKHGFDYIDHYEKDAQYFDYTEDYESPVSRFEQKKLHECILSKINDDEKIILDMGCGNAWVASACLPLGKKVISVDIGLTNPGKALEKYPHDNHFGLVANGLFLPIQPNSVDVVIAAEILEHVVDPTLFLQNLYRVVKPGGKIIVTTPYNEKREFSLCIHCNQMTPRHAHLHSFHEKNIRAILPESCTYKTTIFMNKYLLKIHAHIILQYFPLSLWKKSDSFVEWLRPGALRFMVEIKKPV